MENNQVPNITTIQKQNSIYFNDYNNMLKIHSKFHFDSKKELLSLVENSMVGCGFQPPKHWGKNKTNINDIPFNLEEIELTKQTFETIAKRNNGILEEKEFNIYEISFLTDNGYTNGNIRIRVDFSKPNFEFKIEKDNIPYIVDDYSYDYFLFLYFIINPYLIDENSFQYGITVDDKVYRYLKKETALKHFKEIVDKKINLEIKELLEYRVDVKSINGLFVTKKSKVVLFNAFETTDTKLNVPRSILETLLLLKLEKEEEYNSIGFYFNRKVLTKGQQEKQAVEIIKLVAKKIGYVINKIGEHQVSILYKNKIQIILTTNPNINEELNNRYNTILHIPFIVKAEIIKDRNSIMHESLLSKRYGVPAYPTGERTLIQVLELIEKMREEDLDNVYVVLYNNKKDNSFYSNICYHTFEDALTMKDGFLDKIKDFEKIDLDMEKKLGKAYKYNEKSQSLFYCAIAKNVKLASFYADIIKKCEEHIYT